jgi:hypothetical protein
MGDDLEERICAMLEEHGVANYVLVFADPDDACDRFRVFGSKFWRAGVGMDLIEDVRHRRRMERHEEDTDL